MTPIYRAITANRKDLTSVTVVCPECGTRIMLTIETAKVPSHCPSCEVAISEKVQAALVALGRFHREAKAAEEFTGKDIFYFEIKTEP